MQHLLDKILKIKCLICDVDGVLTNGMNYIDDRGNELKSFYVQDGVGLKLLMAAGIKVAVITGSYNPVIDHRMKQLNIALYFTGQINKLQSYQTIKQQLDIQDEHCAYIGDDVVDLPVMQQVGFSIAVDNAVHLVKNTADWVTTLPGGRGGLREACDYILSTQQKTDEAIQGYIHGIYP